MSVISLVVKNNTSEDKVVRLFDCYQLFNPLEDDSVEIKTIYKDLNYGELLSRLLSSDFKIQFNYITLNSTTEQKPKDIIISYIEKGVYSEIRQINIPLYTHKDQQQSFMIGSHERFLRCTVKNGAYVEYTAIANSTVIINFLNLIDD